MKSYPTATILLAALHGVASSPLRAGEDARPAPPEPLRIAVKEAPLDFEVVDDGTFYWMAALPGFAVLVQPRSLPSHPHHDPPVSRPRGDGAGQRGRLASEESAVVLGRAGDP